MAQEVHKARTSWVIWYCKVIKQAKWILAKRKSLEELEAMRMLQKKARDTRQPLAEVAQAVINAEGLL